MGISVRGMLNWPDSETKRMLSSIKKSDGTPYRDVREFREELMDELSKGHEVLPMSKDCADWDFKTGCPGHAGVNS
jgi:hypothetical protein